MRCQSSGYAARIFFQQPGRMAQGERRIRLQPRVHLGGAPQIFAQAGVEQSPGPGLAEGRRGCDGFVHRRVRGHAHAAELVEPEQQQRVDILVLRLQRPREQQRGDARKLVQPAQRAVGQFLDELALGQRFGTQGFERAVEIAPVHQDLFQHARGGGAGVGGHGLGGVQGRRQRAAVSAASPRRSPTAGCWPLMNSRAESGLPPSSCSCVRLSAPPPVATRRPSGSTAMMVPGADVV